MHRDYEPGGKKESRKEGKKERAQSSLQGKEDSRETPPKGEGRKKEKDNNKHINAIDHYYQPVKFARWSLHTHTPYTHTHTHTHTPLC